MAPSRYGVMVTDRTILGVGWGLAAGTAMSSVSEVSDLATWAADAGFGSFWVSQATAVDPLVALAAANPELEEVGTSVVPIYGRHPINLAQQALTTQSAVCGRLTLGIGPSHAASVEGSMGLAWSRPYSYTEEFLAGLIPLLNGDDVASEGRDVTARGSLDIDAEPVPVLLAALGSRMLELAGRACAGTTVGQCGPRTLAAHVVPRITQAAQAAGRPKPRVVALVRICVTDNVGLARQQAREVAARYAGLPSYAAVLQREGLSEPADLHLIGSWERVLDGLARYSEAGATDLRIEITAPDKRSHQTTRDALAGLLAP